MIKIVIFRDKINNIKRITVSGHAGYAKKGEDIVCAGVSALTYTLLNALEVIAKIHTDCKVENGYVDYILPQINDPKTFEQSQLILNTIVLGYKNMRNSYKSYMEVLEEEV